MQTKFIKRALWGVGAAVMLLAGAAQAKPVRGQGTWETTLQGRDIDGNHVRQSSPSAVFLYDKELKVTWLRDANVSGRMSWASAMSWADNLVVGAYDNWRLPFVVDTGTPGCNFSYSGTDCGYNVQTKVGTKIYSELAHLYYETLGNKAEYDTDGQPQQGSGLTNSAHFRHLKPYLYWLGTEDASDLGYGAWRFNTGPYPGVQATFTVGYAMYAMAVRPGDVAAVPEPHTYALLLLGLGAVMVAVRRRRH